MLEMGFDPRFLEMSGFAVVENAVAEGQIEALLAAVQSATWEVADDDSLLKRGETNYAIRDLLEAVPAVRNFADSSALRKLVEPVLGSAAFVVRGILFDKQPGANWKVPWHQDLTIEVRERKTAPGFGPWSVKAGITHVQPPDCILEQMLAVRIHLDDNTLENGPLKVVAGSHRHGRLTAERMLTLRDEVGETVLTVSRGGAILMRPLLVHASSAAIHPLHRRVIHLEYGAEKLPAGLEWRV